MSEDNPSSCLGDAHLLLFGRVVQIYARYELLMQRLMANVAGCTPAAVMILTRGLDFSAKRGAVLDLLRHSKIPLDQFDHINKLLVVPQTLAQLRHDVAHCIWIKGAAPDSIQPDWILKPAPSVRPLHQTTEASLPVETESDRVTYSLDELEAACGNLENSLRALADYLQEIGLAG
jgi:hypothetical protein